MSEVREAHTYFTYSLHFECAGLLLEMSATQMTQALGAPCNPFVDHLMFRSEYARPFMFAMFKTWIEQQAAPVAPAIKPYNLFGSVSLSSTSKHAPWQIPLLLADARTNATSLLAEKCSLLILIFVNFSHPTLSNTFRAEMQQMHDSDPELVEEGRGDGAHVMSLSHDDQYIHLSFSKLHDAFAKTLADDRTVLLLYFTIYLNHRFLNYVLAKSEPQALILPLLKLAYEARNKPPNSNYMLLVIFLILSNDAIYSSNIHSPDCMMHNVFWFKDRVLANITIGSLMVIILVRIFQRNLRLQDAYLGRNCLAILTNMAPHFNQLHPYAAQRLIFLFEILCKRSEYLSKYIETKPQANAKNANVQAKLVVCLEMRSSCLEIINSALTYALPRNPHIIYALIHKQECFSRFRAQNSNLDMTDNLDTVISFYSKKVVSALSQSEHCSVEKVVQIIKEASMSWTGQLKMIPVLKYNYEEDSSPQEFFTPYVWGQVLLHGGLHFNSQKLHLFESLVDSK
mmetsp:Transcript_534/g.1220  ORF Transcript_534/g.1220 Transcript_534/m.1220 type:complete len:512 (-) Transcript_534:63-1598(-)